MRIRKTIAALIIFLLLLSAFVITAGASQAVTHQNYVNGSSDGMFHPNDTVSRAEMAQMIYNISGKSGNKKQIYSDVKSTAWYYKSVNALSSAGIMAGYSDGTFKPMKAVTRAEFVKILSGLSDKKPAAGKSSFSDVSSSHWAYSAICLAEQMGWVKGSNGQFRPDAAMTRAEAITAINSFLGRIPDKNAINLNTSARYFPDVTPDKWYYYDVMEASISHGCVMGQSTESWTSVTRYYTSLPDGFVLLNNSIFLVKNGYFVCNEGNGSFNGISYYSDKNGRLTLSDGPVKLTGTGMCLIENGKVVMEDGIHFTPSGLYCIKSGRLLVNETYQSLLFGDDGKYTSGNKQIDEYVDRIVSSVTVFSSTKEERLRACYDYIYTHVDYRANNNHVPRGEPGANWTETYMLRLIDTGKGNCYCFAAEMYYLGRRVGYTDIDVVSGGVSPDDLDHGWAVVPSEYGPLLLDPELDASSGPYQGSCFLVTYRNAPFKYWVD